MSSRIQQILFAGSSHLTDTFPVLDQDASSYCHQAASPCCNFTCLNRLPKTRVTPRCVGRVDVDGLASAAAAHLHSLRFPGAPNVEQRERAGG